MIRFLLLSLLLALALRVVGRLIDEFTRGMRGEAPRAGRRPPQRGIQMARDPICGTFVVPERAISVNVGRETVYFCSTACRDKYNAKTA
jgi:YHS domain-containing protein